MGVRCLARSTTTTLDTLAERLANMGAELMAGGMRWHRKCAYQLPRFPEAGLQELFVLQSSEGAEGEQYIVSRSKTTDGGDAVKRVLRAGAEMSAVLEAMQTHSQRLKVTLDGTAHKCGDFVVRFGQLSINNNLAGVAVEVEYLPCNIAAAAATNAPLHAFLDTVLPEDERDFSSSTVECFADACDLPIVFGHEHCVLLFVGLMQSRLLSGMSATSGGAGAAPRAVAGGKRPLS